VIRRCSVGNSSNSPRSASDLQRAERSNAPTHATGSPCCCLRTVWVTPGPPRGVDGVVRCCSTRLKEPRRRRGSSCPDSGRVQTRGVHPGDSESDQGPAAESQDDLRLRRAMGRSPVWLLATARSRGVAVGAYGRWRACRLGLADRGHREREALPAPDSPSEIHTSCRSHRTARRSRSRADRSSGIDSLHAPWNGPFCSYPAVEDRLRRGYSPLVRFRIVVDTTIFAASRAQRRTPCSDAARPQPSL
jgi:hypothetical protein